MISWSHKKHTKDCWALAGNNSILPAFYVPINITVCLLNKIGTGTKVWHLIASLFKSISNKVQVLCQMNHCYFAKPVTGTIHHNNSMQRNTDAWQYAHPSEVPIHLKEIIIAAHGYIMYITSSPFKLVSLEFHYISCGKKYHPFGPSMPQILCFMPTMNLLGCTDRFFIVRRLALQQQRYARTRWNVILSVKPKQKVALDQRDAWQQWA